MKEFWKSVKIRQGYHEKFDAPFLGHSVYVIDSSWHHVRRLKNDLNKKAEKDEVCG